jgi:uncharacterized C2H2 Zn-finger protein
MGNCFFTDDSASMQVGSRFFSCDACRKTFNTKNKLKEHKNDTHPKDVFPCPRCRLPFWTSTERDEHYNKMTCTKKKISFMCLIFFFGLVMFKYLCNFKFSFNVLSLVCVIF